MSVGVFDWIAFVIPAVIILAGGLWTVLAHKTFHSAMGLGVTLIGVAILYVTIGSPFLGVIQLIVYVGGILTLFVFAIMFVGASEDEEVEA